jgi:hypothetical protein
MASVPGINYDTAPVNPLVPTSVGSLIAEETMIDCTSILPSFLEHVMMQECRTSAWKTLHLIMDTVIDKLKRMEDEPPGEWISVIPKLLQHMLKYLRISKLLRTFHSSLRFLLVYWIQRTSLLKQNALLEETLYGCKRMKAVSDTTGHNRAKLQTMTKRDAIWLAFMSSLGPYLQEQGNHETMMPNALVKYANKFLATEKLQRIQSFCEDGLAPLVRLTLYSAAWLQQWQFLMGRSVYYNLPSRVLHLVVRRVTQQDLQQEQQRHSSMIIKNDAAAPTLHQAIASGKNQKMAVGILSAMVALSWMARIRSIRQQLQQQQQNEQDGNATDNHFPGSAGNKVVPPPPLATNTTALPFPNLSAKVCPLCQEPRIHPTTTIHSNGFVFCYKCILRHVEEYGKCPATGRSCTILDLVRLYEPHP